MTSLTETVSTSTIDSTVQELEPFTYDEKNLTLNDLFRFLEYAKKVDPKFALGAELLSKGEDPTDVIRKLHTEEELKSLLSDQDEVKEISDTRVDILKAHQFAAMVESTIEEAESKLSSSSSNDTVVEKK